MNLQIWPKEIKVLLATKIRTSTINTTKTNKNDIYIQFVNTLIQELSRVLTQFQLESSNMKSTLMNDFTFANEEIFQTYLPEKFHSFPVEVKHKMELVHCHHHIRALNHNNYDQLQMINKFLHF